MTEDGFELDEAELENLGSASGKTEPEETEPETPEVEAKGEEKTGDDKDQTIAELKELSDKQLAKIIGDKHAEKEWQRERAELNERIAKLEAGPAEVEISPIDKWLSEQNEADRNELTDADIPLVVSRAEKAYQAKQATSQDQGNTLTEQQVSARLNEVWEDEEAKGLFEMADVYLTKGERTGIVGQLMQAKDGKEAARITKQVSLAIIERRGSKFHKNVVNTIRPKSSKTKTDPKNGDGSENDDDLKDLDFTGLQNTRGFMDWVD